MPSKEKIMMKRKSSNSSEAMDFMEFNKDATRLLREVQCLQVKGRGVNPETTGEEESVPHSGRSSAYRSRGGG